MSRLTQDDLDAMAELDRAWDTMMLMPTHDCDLTPVPLINLRVAVDPGDHVLAHRADCRSCTWFAWRPM